MDSNTANVLEQKKVFTKQKGLTPSGLVWTPPTYIAAAVSLFWDTNSNNDSHDYENVTKKRSRPASSLNVKLGIFTSKSRLLARRSRAVKAKKCTKKRDARAELLFVS